MTVRGSTSIDRPLTVKDKDWCPREELNAIEIRQLIKIYSENKPKIMITHDCPTNVLNSFFNCKFATKTNQLFQLLHEIHKPDLWIFGHYNQSKNKTINNTKFIALNELDIILI